MHVWKTEQEFSPLSLAYWMMTWRKVEIVVFLFSAPETFWVNAHGIRVWTANFRQLQTVIYCSNSNTLTYHQSQCMVILQGWIGLISLHPQQFPYMILKKGVNNKLLSHHLPISLTGQDNLNWLFFLIERRLLPTKIRHYYYYGTLVIFSIYLWIIRWMSQN